MRTAAIRWPYSLAAIAIVMIAATAITNLMASSHERGLFDLTHDEAIHRLGEVRSDLSQLRAVLRRYQTDPDTQRQGAIIARFENLRTQLTQVKLGYASRIASDPMGLAAFVSIDDAVSALPPLLADPAKPENIAAVRDLTRSLDGSIGVVMSVASSDLNHDIEREDTKFRSAYDANIWLNGGLLVFSLALVVVFVRINKRLHDFARRDALTGLQNRLTFSETLSALIEDPGAGNEVALMLLDIDFFKDINDTLGHTAGDLLLKELARRLARLSREGVFLSRLGGDEFAIVLTGRNVYHDARAMAERICELVKEPFQIELKTIDVGLSIGIAYTPAGWCYKDLLLKNADIALYAAKGAGRGTFRFFDPKMDRELRRRREMENDLREAIADDQLQLHYQPIVDLQSNAIVSCEALARWHHPRHGFIPPMRFIGIAEEIGLIQQMGAWILRQACLAARQWPEDVRVSINLSPRQFDGDALVPTLRHILGETGIAARRIELEITESVLLRESDHVLRTLAELKGLGVRIALDDFGTGYSSLSYLQRFPIDKIKIDQSFVRDITTKPHAAAIVESIGFLAKKLGIVTTAEGIETEPHAALLRLMGCDEGQGYLFDRPLTHDACLARLAGTTIRQAAA